jgi:putative tricarboxylic transport membrane protein
LDFSLAPVILGVVLGNIFEDNLRRALSMSGGDWSILVQSSNSWLLYGLACLVVFLPLVFRKRQAQAV